LLTLNGGEHLGRVLESDWSFSQGVADGKQVDESFQKVRTISGLKYFETHKTTGPICSPLEPSFFNSDRPAANKKIHMRGKVFERYRQLYLLLGK
jgi:hypothetical protein